MIAFSLRGVYTRALAADPATAEQGSQYLAWFVPAMTLQFGMVALGSALRGIGDMKIPTLMQVGTVAINIVLAPVLIAGWGTGRPLGTAGAGLATFIAVLVGSAAFILYFRTAVESGAVPPEPLAAGLEGVAADARHRPAVGR